MILEVNKDNSVELSAISEGHLFIKDGCVFVKVAGLVTEEGLAVNCVQLMTGGNCYFAHNEKVVAVKRVAVET